MKKVENRQPPEVLFNQANLLRKHENLWRINNHRSETLSTGNNLFSQSSQLMDVSTVDESDAECIDNCSLFSSDVSDDAFVEHHSPKSTLSRMSNPKVSIRKSLTAVNVMSARAGGYDNKCFDAYDESGSRNRSNLESNLSEVKMLLEGKSPDDKLRLITDLADQVVTNPYDIYNKLGSRRHEILESVLKSRKGKKAKNKERKSGSMET
jgi:hypothetical protein